MISLAAVGTLENNHGERSVLWADHLIGRAPEAELPRQDGSVSWRHASIRWSERGWEIRDLGSLNGTYLNGTRMEAGARPLLRIGMQLRFGEEPVSWTVVDIDPPAASVTDLLTGAHVLPHEGLIVLPDPETPELSLYRAADGAWVAEGPEGVWTPQRDELLTAGGRRFRFEPGSVMHATSTDVRRAPTPAALSLDFAVSRNEEQVDLTIVYAGQRTVLKPRAHTYLLLTLARLRLKDQGERALPPSSHGWVEQARLLRMLNTNLSQLTLDIYRARRQFGEAGIADAAQLIERRTTSRELRIGTDRLSVGTH